MKKKTFGTYLKRILIALIFVVIISLVGIFIFDRYESADSSYTNEFSNEYWDMLEGFQRYDELKAEDEKNNINSSEYILPYDVNATIAQKISSTRYVEEYEFLVKPIQDRYTVVQKEIAELDNLTKASKADWLIRILGISLAKELETVYELVSADPDPETDGDEYVGTDTEFYSLLNNYQTRSLYQAVVACGYTGSLKNLVSCVANGSDSDALYNEAVSAGFKGSFNEWVVEVTGFNNYNVDDDYSAYSHVKLNGYNGTIEEWYQILEKTGEIDSSLAEQGYYVYIGNITTDYDLYMSIYNDNGKVDPTDPTKWIVRPAYDLANVKDETTYNALVNECVYLESVINHAEEHKAAKNLKKWNEYFQRFQLIEELSNDKFDFYFSFGLTTFKLVDKASGYEWYSNPENVAPNLKKEQNTVLNVIYGTPTGAEVLYSNYEYAVSTTNLVTGRAVDPNYAVKIIDDGEKKAIQVWYRIEKRGIDYTYFPQYISVERVEELLARNAERAESGMVDSDGKKIPNIVQTTNAYVKAANEQKLLDPNNPDQAEKYAELEAIKKTNENGYECYSKWLLSWYQILDADSPSNLKDYDYYEYKGGTFSYMSEIQINSLNTWMYDWCGYTSADLVQDNAEFEKEFEVNSFAFEVAIEYRMTDEGLKVIIPGNSIREFGDYQLSKIEILPYFTAAPDQISGNEVDGYTIIPDGSGAILEHNNQKAALYDPYVKRIYTTDLSQSSVTKKATNYDILFPMYSVVNTVNGVTSAVIVEAESMAVQLEFRATTSGYGTLGENHNRNNFTAYLREGQLVKIGVYSKEPVQKFTAELIREDIILDYTFYSNAQNSEYQNQTIDYSFIAERYREKIVEKYGMQDKKDTTTTPVLELDVIGAYTYKDNFLGISYQAKGSMTTYKELQEMIKKYNSLGVEYINVFYDGWRKEALVDVSFKKFKTNNILGSKADLQNVAKLKNVTVYPNVSFAEINDYQESFGSNHYTTRDVIGEIITKKPYAINTNTFDPKGRTISVVSPHYYYAFANSLVDAYKKLFGDDVAKANGVGINSISINKLGSVLAGDYKKNNEMYKTGAIREQIRSLDLISKNVNNINLFTPYEYALKYISHAKNVPFESTQKELLDYSIPFYQLVINGMIDYSSDSINATIESGVTYHVMKLIETGANPQFTFTYDSSSELIRTEYNYYYNTQYTEWLTEVQTIYNELKKLGIYNGRLVSHEMIEANVFMVTYQLNTGEQVKICLNYSFSPITVGSTVVAAKSYEVIK